MTADELADVAARAFEDATRADAASCVTAPDDAAAAAFACDPATVLLKAVTSRPA
ncbi:hypothetical protein [Blastococcus colisei]|uniref:hypothetical protein n=1 Tax=Blastococcus colisei TaxID=1564162 RepID=UPI001477767B|nr:hypothetical protein [Blastococcus colisei]